ncbi:MAG: hypothetical protein ACOCZ5_02200 [bacterium]
MNLRTKKTILMAMFNILLLISFFALTMETVNTHEHAHKEIAQNHGCVEWRIEQNFKGGGEFECLQYYDNLNKEQEQMLHSINEIVGYNVSSIISAIVIAVLIIMNTMFIRWIHDE